MSSFKSSDHTDANKKNIKNSSFKSSENIQKKECGPDRLDMPQYRLSKPHQNSDYKNWQKVSEKEIL